MLWSNVMIRSCEYDQSEILKGIMQLCGIECFGADITYGNGAFYKNIPQPVLKFDIDPQVEGVIEASSVDLPVDSASLRSLVFDPPFMTYVRAGRSGNGNMIMAKRFGGYWRYDELEDHYRSTLEECGRVLSKKGIMVFKCQDIVHNHKLHPTHIFVTEWMRDWFRLKDLFILAAKSRMPIPQKEGERKKVQKHSRIHHSYCMVLERL
jgi:tRNA G10  N-methylase Trm11